MKRILIRVVRMSAANPESCLATKFCACACFLSSLSMSSLPLALLGAVVGPGPLQRWRRRQFSNILPRNDTEIPRKCCVRYLGRCLDFDTEPSVAPSVVPV